MLRFLVVGDAHHSDYAPVSRADNYTEEMLNEEREISKLSLELKVDAVIRTGDIIHIKSPSKTSHRLISELISIYKTITCKNLSIVGNHDISFGQLASLSSQPIWSLVQSGVLEFIPETGQSPISIGNVNLWGIYGYGDPDGEDKTRYVVPQGEKVNIVVTHSFLLPENTKFPGVVKVTHMSDINNSGVDLFLGGHIHDHMGISRYQDTWLAMPGSISRGSIKEFTKDRMPVVTLVEISGKGSFKFEEIPLKSARPNKEIFKPNIVDSELDSPFISETSSNSVSNFVDLRSEKEFSLDAEIRDAINEEKLRREPGEYLLSL